MTDPVTRLTDTLNAVFRSVKSSTHSMRDVQNRAKAAAVAYAIAELKYVRPVKMEVGIDLSEDYRDGYITAARDCVTLIEKRMAELQTADKEARE